MGSSKAKRTSQLVLFLIGGIALVLVNWYFVDPLHIRVLPSAARYLLTVLLGMPLGWLMNFAANQVLARLPGWNVLRTGISVVLGMAVLFPLLQFVPAPNHLSVTWVKITVADQPDAVRLDRVRVGKDGIGLDRCDRDGEWNDLKGSLIAGVGANASLNCPLVEKAGTPIEVVFGVSKPGTVVQVSLDDAPAVSVDLSTAQVNHQVYYQTETGSKPGFALALAVRALDSLALLLSGFGLGVLAGRVIRGKTREKIQQALAAFNSWFDDTTPRFQWVAVAAAVGSAVLSAILLLQPRLPVKTAAEIQAGSGTQRPNILFIVVDALSANDMSLFGYPLPTTPNLEKITRQWSVYSNAQSPLTCTMAAFPTFTTGRYPYTNDFYKYNDRGKTRPGWISLPQVMKNAGYTTWWNGYLSPGFYHAGSGFEHTACRAGDSLHTTLYQSNFMFRAIAKSNFPFVPLSLAQTGFMAESEEDFYTCQDFAPFTQAVDTQGVQQPFYFYYHYRGTHGIPYRSEDFLGTFLPREAGLISEAAQKQGYGFYPPEKQPLVDQLRLRYDESIAYQDHTLAGFFDYLKEKGLYDNTLIIITGDHGQSFENSYSSHCTSLVSYAEAHVPLLVKFPGQQTGQRYDQLVSTVDVVPTILDAAGFSYPENWFDGISLLKQASQPVAGRLVFTRRPSYSRAVYKDYAVTDGKYRLVSREGELHLFDIQQDPDERQNLIQQSEITSLPAVQRLQQALENYQARINLLRAGGNILDAPALLPQ